MGYKIRKVSLENFKYVKEDKILEVDFNDASLVLLNGPNGYGKTTTFEAIELLLNGDIKSFNANLKNKGSISKSILANNPLKNIILTAELVDDAGKVSIIRRSIECGEDFNSTIEINNEIVTQEELEYFLKFNKNIFDIGMYISQKESLGFLEKKYGDRKEIISGILDNSNIQSKLDYLKKLENEVKNKIVLRKNKYENDIKKINEELTELQSLETKVSNLPKNIEYKRLFKDDEYSFDLEKLDVSISYDLQIEPLKNILEFIKNFTKYKNTKQILKLKKVLNLNEINIKAIYYSNVINDIKSKQDILSNIKIIEELLKIREYKDAVTLGKMADIDEEEIAEVEEIIQNYNKFVIDLETNEKDKLEFIRKRKILISLFEKNVKNNNFDKNVCPLCGNSSTELRNLFKMTEKTLEVNNTLIEKNLKLLKDKLDNYFNNIQNINDKKRALYEEDYKLYLDLEKYINIDISNLTDEKNTMIELNFINNDGFSNEKFDDEYSMFKVKIKNKIKNLGEQLSDNVIKDYDNLVNKYYKNSIKHSKVEINNKIAYIADKYASKYSSQIVQVQKKLDNKLEQYEKINRESNLAQNTITSFRNKYAKAFKLYQTKLVENIKIPLYINTGKIIQNYPMGLGINVNIKDNQIIFQTDSKNDDIFNYLSLGQLNGVALAIMLAVRSTINFENGLDLIMIDDPLQSIDDISAFSFADLLAESFSNSQIIMSTHEEDKSNLLEFKYKQHNKAVRILNMYEKYISN